MVDPLLGSQQRPLRVAVVGSGPSAFYAVEALFKVGDLHVRADVFDRLPTPYGLVRGGVAPDHQKIKNVIRVYEKIAANEGFRFFGNVKLGRDLQVQDLVEHYDQIVYAVGNEGSRELGIPGEDLDGVHSATEFVFWYNGHPDYRHLSFDLKNATRVAVVGNGNVAMDVTRILIQDHEQLKETDIADYALDALAGSGIKEVILLGRRGPAQAAFSTKEIQEIAALTDSDTVVSEQDVVVDDVTAKWLSEGAPKAAQRNLTFLTELAAKGEGSHKKKVRCRFLTSPVEVLGEDGKVSGVRLERGELYTDDYGIPRPKGTGQHDQEEIQLLFAAIGYRGTELPGVPFDQRRSVIPNVDGRVVTDPESEDVVPDQYVVGWAKRGPTGLIGTNSPDSKATVEAMIEDLRDRRATPLPDGDEKAIVTLLGERGVDFVTYQDWKNLDQHEVEQGKASGSIRRKLTSVEEIMAVIRAARG
ncbi:MAG: FAD-dependent oxidoreductase [Planctomycetota bacterium]|jgi:ferredoxin--NADP+ reductase